MHHSAPTLIRRPDWPPTTLVPPHHNPIMQGRLEGYPGIPIYTEDAASLQAGQGPAARAIRKSPSEQHQCAPCGISEGCGRSSPPTTNPPHQPILRGIVERKPSAASFRPPTAPKAQPIATANSPQLEDIDAENRKLIEAMTEEEILAEQARLKSTLPPKLFERWSAKK